MLGILCYNEDTQSNKIEQCIVDIHGVKFYEIELDLKGKITDKKSKRHIKKVFKILKKQGIKQICSHKVFDDFIGEISYHPHNFIWSVKQNEIIELITQKNGEICIFGSDLNQNTTDFLNFCAKRFDNIYVDFGQNTQKVCDMLIKTYGISAIKLDLNYDLREKTVVCFSVPSKIFTNKILINFSGKKIEQKNATDFECTVENYSKNTDITAICNYICLENRQNAKYIKIKNILTKT